MAVASTSRERHDTTRAIVFFFPMIIVHTHVRARRRRAQQQADACAAPATLTLVACSCSAIVFAFARPSSLLSCPSSPPHGLRRVALPLPAPPCPSVALRCAPLPARGACAAQSLAARTTRPAQLPPRPTPRGSRACRNRSSARLCVAPFAGGVGGAGRRADQTAGVGSREGGAAAGRQLSQYSALLRAHALFVETQAEGCPAHGRGPRDVSARAPVTLRAHYYNRLSRLPLCRIAAARWTCTPPSPGSYALQGGHRSSFSLMRPL